MTLFLIPARAGSKRLPGKNKRLFCGLPLFQWSVATAVRTGAVGDICLASSDDPDIYEAPFGICRPDELCRDDTTSQAVVDFYWNQFPGERTAVLLQPTSPTRPDSLVRQLIAHGGQVRSVTNGVPNGACYVYRKGVAGWTDVETPPVEDIDTLEQFIAAEKEMLKRFA